MADKVEPHHNQGDYYQAAAHAQHEEDEKAAEQRGADVGEVQKPEGLVALKNAAEYAERESQCHVGPNQKKQDPRRAQEVRRNLEEGTKVNRAQAGEHQREHTTENNEPDEHSHLVSIE